MKLVRSAAGNKYDLSVEELKERIINIIESEHEDYTIEKWEVTEELNFIAVKCFYEVKE